MLSFRLGLVRASSLRPRAVALMIVTGCALLTIGTVGHQGHPGPGVMMPPLSAAPASLTQATEQLAQSAPVQALAEAAKAAVETQPEIATREVELGRSQTIASMLASAGATPEDADAAADALETVYPHRKLRAGQDMTLTFSRLGDDETLTGLTFQPEATREVSLMRSADGTFTAESKATPIERKRFAVHGDIQSSLYQAGAQQGVPRSVMAAMLRAYAHAVDFQRDVHPGDSFDVFYDQPTTRNGTPVGQGVIIYAAMNIGGKVLPLYRVTFADGTSDYFDEKGNSIRRTLLRTPVENVRVTSGFGMRRHPILGFSRMHKGVDFGAPSGAPILAAGSGTIVEVGYKGGYGRYIRVRHNNQLETAYAHMSRFARGMQRGAHVSQGDVIGFVGMTGRATGPHLHFEVHVNGQPINPLNVKMPSGRTLSGQLMAQFRKGQSKIKDEFNVLLKAKTNTEAAASPPTQTVAAPAAPIAKAVPVSAPASAISTVPRSAKS